MEAWWRGVGLSLTVMGLLMGLYGDGSVLSRRWVC